MQHRTDGSWALGGTTVWQWLDQSSADQSCTHALTQAHRHAHKDRIKGTFLRWMLQTTTHTNTKNKPSPTAKPSPATNRGAMPPRPTPPTRADLWFTYNVRNTGTEYAREIGNLAFNVYIGDDPNPVYTYFVAPRSGRRRQVPQLHARRGPATVPYQYSAIPLTLGQLRPSRLILCAMLRSVEVRLTTRCWPSPVQYRIVVEDFTYGADELFYQDAANAGVHARHGGRHSRRRRDHRHLPDPHLGRRRPCSTCWAATSRTPPTPMACWSPSGRPNIAPTRRPGASSRKWWASAASGRSGASTRSPPPTGGTSTPTAWATAPKGSRTRRPRRARPPFSASTQDSDLDGYSDRSEVRLGTDPNDPASYPKPELLAGVNSIRSGNNVVATLSLLNTGLYDAYGVEAVMIAPNDTIAITNNTVGGSGRVRAQKQVIVGSRIVPQTPLPAAWLAAGHAQPAAGGYYTGTTDPHLHLHRRPIAAA